MTFSQYVLCFFIYAFLGYVCEVIYCSIGQRKLVNRGYLYSPICPIYGYGAVLVIFAMTPIKNLGTWYFPLVFLAGTILVTILEYLTSYFMEKLFHMRWWDYSRYKFQINGRVCLLNSTLFGLLIMVVMYVIQPFIEKYILANINNTVLYSLDGVLFSVMVVDTIFSTIKNINIANVIVKLSELEEKASVKLNEIKDEASLKINTIKDEASEKLAETKKRLTLKLEEFTKKYPNLLVRKIGRNRKTCEEIIDDNLKMIEDSKDEK